MEPPRKRQKVVTTAAFVNDGTDHSSRETQEEREDREEREMRVHEQWQAQNRFRHRMEDIFNRYEADFTEDGDEVNIRTGAIEVDRGHLSGLPDADYEDDSESFTSDEDGIIDDHDDDILDFFRTTSKAAPDRPHVTQDDQDPQFPDLWFPQDELKSLSNLQKDDLPSDASILRQFGTAGPAVLEILKAKSDEKATQPGAALLEAPIPDYLLCLSDDDISILPSSLNFATPIKVSSPKRILPASVPVPAKRSITPPTRLIQSARPLKSVSIELTEEADHAVCEEDRPLQSPGDFDCIEIPSVISLIDEEDDDDDLVVLSTPMRSRREVSLMVLEETSCRAASKSEKHRSRSTAGLSHDPLIPDAEDEIIMLLAEAEPTVILSDDDTIVEDCDMSNMHQSNEGPVFIPDPVIFKELGTASASEIDLSRSDASPPLVSWQTSTPSARAANRRENIRRQQQAQVHVLTDKPLVLKNPRKFACVHCGNTFQRPRNLNLHAERSACRLKYNPFFCPYGCNERFPKHDLLVAHLDQSCSIMKSLSNAQRGTTPGCDNPNLTAGPGPPHLLDSSISVQRQCSPVESSRQHAEVRVPTLLANTALVHSHDPTDVSTTTEAPCQASHVSEDITSQPEGSPACLATIDEADLAPADQASVPTPSEHDEPLHHEEEIIRDSEEIARIRAFAKARRQRQVMGRSTTASLPSSPQERHSHSMPPPPPPPQQTIPLRSPPSPLPKSELSLCEPSLSASRPKRARKQTEKGLSTAFRELVAIQNKRLLKQYDAMFRSAR